MGRYEEIRDWCLKKGILYEDPEFPAGPRSVYYSKRDDSVVWKRPREISDPKFMIDGATRFDLDQGKIGNCWFIASAATLATQPELLARVVPRDQGFDHDYAGVFHFFFWRYGCWTEVIIDDRLPTDRGRSLLFCKNREDPREFWSPLLEKAYAKLVGSYEAMEGGMMEDALVDFTGGTSQRIDLRDKQSVEENLFDKLYHFYQMNSLMGCCIFATKEKMENELSNGLIIGHAYSITRLAKIRQGRTEHHLLRLRNPWGKKEWKGAWGDTSKEWNSIDPQTRQHHGLVYDNDGEFWMEYEDWLNNFQQVQICHLTPDNRMKDKRVWRAAVHHGAWVRGVSAGGCGNSPHQKLFWSNPQYAITLKEPDVDDPKGKCWLIIALMQKYGRAMRTRYATDDTLLPIAFDLYKARSNAGDRVLEGESDYDPRALQFTKRGSKYFNYRETTSLFHLEPGTYVVIPSTFEPGCDRQFLLRMLSEQNPASIEIDVPTGPIVGPKPVDRHNLRALFEKHAGSDRVVDAHELQLILSAGFAEELGENHAFEGETCRSLLAMMDKNKSGVLEYEELKTIWTELNVWKDCFKKFDYNQSGFIEVQELKSVFKYVGYHLSRRVLESIVRRYGGKHGRLCYSDFVMVMCKCTSLINEFPNFSPDGLRGKAEMTLDEFLSLVMFF